MFRGRERARVVEPRDVEVPAGRTGPSSACWRRPPPGRFDARPAHRQAEPRPASCRPTDSARAAWASTRASAACSSGFALLGELERLGQRDRDLLAPAPRAAAQSATRGPAPARRSSASSLTSRPAPPGRATGRLPPLRARARRHQAVAHRVADPQHVGVGDPVEDPVPVPPRLHEAGAGQARQVLRHVGLGAARSPPPARPRSARPAAGRRGAPAGAGRPRRLEPRRHQRDQLARPSRGTLHS